METPKHITVPLCREVRSWGQMKRGQLCAIVSGFDYKSKRKWTLPHLDALCGHQPVGAARRAVERPLHTPRELVHRALGRCTMAKRRARVGHFDHIKLSYGFAALEVLGVVAAMAMGKRHMEMPITRSTGNPM